jgi:hypothetical protein
VIVPRTTDLLGKSSPSPDPNTFSKASLSPHVARQNSDDMSNHLSPMQAYSASDNPSGTHDNTASQASTAGREGLLEQKIFPGIMHEMAQRGSVPDRALNAQKGAIEESFKASTT